MNKPQNYISGGPKYQDQMYDSYIHIMNSNSAYPKEYAFDECMKSCEHAHNERIRNIITPFNNLLVLVEHIVNNPNKQEEYINMIKQTNLIDICKQSEDRILNIQNQ